MKKYFEIGFRWLVKASNAPTSLLATAVTLIGLFTAPANSFAQNPFSIDGTVPDAGAIQFSDPSASDSELGPVNASGTKIGVIHLEAVPMLEFTNPNGQVDFVNVWLTTAVAADGDIWLYFAWERDSTTGSGVITYEFQQDAAPPNCDYSGIDQILPEDPAETTLIANCNPWANRANDDFLIVWDQQGRTINIILRTFDGSDFDAGVTLNATVSAAALNGDTSRGEAAVNLSQTVFPLNPTECFSVANIIPGTVTGNSDQADFKDTVLADFTDSITISNCGIVRVEKVTDPIDEVGPFPYTLDQADGGDINFGGDTSLSNNLPADGDFDLIVDLLADTDYQLTEDLTGLPEWGLVDIVCDGNDVTAGTFAVVAGATTSCTITNARRAPQNAAATLRKIVINDDGGLATVDNFRLRAELTGESDPACIGGGFNPLPDISPPGIFPNTDVPEPPEGNVTGFLSASTAMFTCKYELVEDGVPGYAASAWDCGVLGMVPLGGVLELSEAEVTEVVVCTITNNDISPTLTVIKTVVNDNGGGAAPDDFKLTVDAGAVLSGVTNDFDAGDHTVAETLLAGYAAGAWGGDCAADGSITLALDQDATCTITNDDISPTLTVIKTINNGSNPGGTVTDPDAFNLTVDGGSVSSGATNDVNAGDHTVAESLLAGYTAGDWGGDCATDGSITLALDQDATCTITNTAQGMVMVNKTSSGQPAEGFTFEIRQNASTVSGGDILHTDTTDALGVADFGGLKLHPGTYQLCETGMMPGWSNTISGFTPLGATPEGGDNSTECVDFTLEVGETQVFNVDNIPPPGGDARTIGFWKNWTSCDGHGHQDPVLDDNLPVTIGSLPILECAVAVDLLDKRKIGNPAVVKDGRKSASDPAYNMVAQLVAAKLNLNAGAGFCPDLTAVIEDADMLLSDIDFDGAKNHKNGPDKLTQQEKALANQLASDLDDYNNNLPGSLCN